MDEALREAADCLEEAIAIELSLGYLFLPFRLKRGQRAAPVAAQTARKRPILPPGSADYQGGTSEAVAVRRKRVRRLLTLGPSKLPRIEAALAAVGHRLIVSLQSAV